MKIIFFLVLTAVISSAAYGASSLLQIGVGPGHAGSGGGGGGGCTNKLDFSDACNSQYINTIVNP